MGFMSVFIPLWAVSDLVGGKLLKCCHSMSAVLAFKVSVNSCKQYKDGIAASSDQVLGRLLMALS